MVDIKKVADEAEWAHYEAHRKPDSGNSAE